MTQKDLMQRLERLRWDHESQITPRRHSYAERLIVSGRLAVFGYELFVQRHDGIESSCDGWGKRWWWDTSFCTGGNALSLSGARKACLRALARQLRADFSRLEEVS